MTKVDLKHTYFMIPIHEKNRPMLRFLNSHAYRSAYCAAPVGLYQTLRPAIVRIQLVVYINGILVMGKHSGPSVDIPPGIARIHPSRNKSSWAEPDYFCRTLKRKS